MSEANYFRLIEAYFEGSITTTEKIMLENQLVKDPLLKAEFDLQRNIQEGISNVRHQQLKQRLASIDVAPVSINLVQSSAIKWLTSTVAAATLLGGLLFWVSGDNNPIIPVDIQLMEQLSFENQISQPLSFPEITIAADEEESNETPTSIKKNDIIEKLATNTDSEEKKTNSIAIRPQSLLSFEDEKLFVNNSGSELEKMKPIDIKIAKVKETNIEVLLPHQTNKFHYQYFNNKLFLYGDFDEEPYEIVEMKQEGNRKLFLSYKESVYIIEADKKEITELKVLNDTKLLNELEIITSTK